MSKRDSATRRDFLKTATAVAVGAPYVITSSMRRACAAPANERITMGIIGPGKQGLGLLKKFMRFSDTQMIAVCDVSTARREYARKVVDDRYTGAKDQGSFKGCKAYADFRALLARDDIDAVIIAVPDHWHAIVAIEACKQGKDIYCEKPLSLTIHEARQMTKAVRKYDRIFQTGSQQRSEFEGKFHRACELVRNGRVGAVQKVLVSVRHPNWNEYAVPCDLPAEPVPDGLDWNFWLGPAPLRDYHSKISPAGIPTKPPVEQRDKIAWYDHYPSWRDYREYSGGTMTDFGAHNFDIAQWGLGMDHSGPVEVIPPKDGEPMTYKYANGVIMQKVPEINETQGVTFIGAEGSIEVTRTSLKLEPESIGAKPIPPDGVHLDKAENQDHKLDFVNCVKSRKRPIADVEIGAHSVTVCHLGNLAYWNNRTLRWDPENWHFVGDDEANSWLDRPKRAPWKLPAI